MNKLPTSRHENASQITTEHFVHPHPLKTAVFFLIFNRPDTTKQVSEIRERIIQITDETEAVQLRQKLTEAAQIQKERSEKMWAKVFECKGV